MIDDTDIVTLLQPGPDRTVTRPHSRYSLSLARVVDGSVHAQLTRGSAHAYIRLALPSSGLPMPWLYDEPEDAAEWVDQLFIWLDEEVDTAGLSESRVREVINGHSYVVVTGYGFELVDRSRHERLDRLAGPNGTWSSPRSH